MTKIIHGRDSAGDQNPVEVADKKTKIAQLREAIGVIMVQKTPRRGFTAKQRRTVYEAQGGCCAGCEAALEGSWPIDHVKALADGGEHAPGNWLGLCVPCHADKTKREATARAKTERLRKADLEPAQPGKIKHPAQYRWPSRKMESRPFPTRTDKPWARPLTNPESPTNG